MYNIYCNCTVFYCVVLLLFFPSCNMFALNCRGVVFNSRFINFKPLDVNIVQVLNVQSFTGLEPSRVWINHVLQLIWVMCNIVWRSHNNTQGHFLQIRRAAIMQKVKLHCVRNEKIPSSSCMRTAATMCHSWCACGRVSVSSQCVLAVGGTDNLAGSCCGFLLVPLMA